MANTYLTRSKSSPTSDKIGTISFWVKRSKLTQEQSIIVSGSGSIDSNIYFNGSNDKLHVYDYQSGAFNFEYITTRVFRDPSAWYAITVEIDTTLTTASDRVKIYINGVRETVFDTATTPNQNITPLFFTSANPFYIGAYRGSSGFCNLLLSHFHYTDGTAYGASTFGYTDSTTGEWNITTSPSITMGTNGFTILKDGNTITDQSTNSNDFTLGGGTLTNTEDNPSNVFATFNPLIANTGATFANGNTFVYRTTSGNYRRIGCTLGATSGKYYAEFQLGASQWGGVCLTNGGDIARTEADSNGYMGEYNADYSVGIRQDGVVYSHGINVSSTQWNQGSLGTTDKLCLALDMDNKKLFLGKNGTWNVSSNPATNTGGISLTGDSYTFCGATSNADCKINTGNGYFGTDVISSEGTNASGIGKFEYDVPTGFTALSTKGLNE